MPEIKGVWNKRWGDIFEQAKIPKGHLRMEGKTISNLKIMVLREWPELTTITLLGELDVDGARRLKQVIAEVKDGAPRLILDLSQLDFMDGYGLRTVIEADLEARVSGSTLQIREGPSMVHKVFRLTGFDNRLNFLPVAVTPKF